MYREEDRALLLSALNGTSSLDDDTAPDAQPQALALEDFYAYLPDHTYVYMPTGETWPAASVNDKFKSPVEGKSASAWLAKERSLEQKTWAPGQPQIITDKLFLDGEWKSKPGAKCLNTYRAPEAQTGGDPTKAARWIEHIKHIYPEDADHIIKWLAHRVQKPGEKINHALVLGGAPGIGKDTLLEPVKRAVGGCNWAETKPQEMVGDFNPFVRSVVLRISEARDLGDSDLYSFYEHMKTYTAAPPDVHSCNEKFKRPYAVPNVCGVIITTNHKTTGIYLPPDDRRHYVAWSDRQQSDFDTDPDDFEPEYWSALWAWYESGGYAHVAAYLAALDLSGFDPKAPPKKTPAFWDIADANRAPEDAEMADAIDALGKPKAVTVAQITGKVSVDLAGWLCERRNARQIPHRLEAVGYTAVRNDADAHDGRWRVNGKRQMIYARKELPTRERIAAARRLAQP
jgi:hypothetical protein